MNIDSAYIFLLVVSVSLMLAQLFVTKKQLEHIFFAILCGSLAMVAVKHLSADVLGPYQYIIGFGTSATCNAMWLVSRAMFRGSGAIQVRHILLATVIAVLVMLNQGLQMATDLHWLSANAASYFDGALGEITQMMSSTVLVLTFWEALRPSHDKSRSRRWQRGIFACSFLTGVMLCTVVLNGFIEPSVRSTILPWFVTFSAIQIMLATQLVLMWKAKTLGLEQDKTSASSLAVPSITNLSQRAEKSGESIQPNTDPELVSGIIGLLQNDKQYLKHNLKMIDVANRLGVSEYKVSRAIRYHFKAKNFNHFVNQYRIEHAKVLLQSTDGQQWSILVIGLESGFSSVPSFNRAFKMAMNCSPSEFRHGVSHNQQVPVSLAD